MSEPYSALGGQRPAKPKPRRWKPRKPQWSGCLHTDDPYGWLIRADGSISGRCECWEEEDEKP